jgi:formylglycine-generating enzyme required for sulfatase activity
MFRYFLAVAMVTVTGVVGTARADQPPPPSTQPAVVTTTQPAGAATPLVLDLGKGVTMKLALVPAGKFTMGSPADEAGRRDDEAPHEVTLSQPFYLGQTLVTQGQYEAVMGHNPSQVNRGPNYPVDSVSWHDAMTFSQKLGQATKQRISLPTEAQWEYACRAGSQTRFSCGDDEALLRKYALFWARTTLPVAKFKPNGWGLYDMHGNLHEWSADWYGPYPDKPATDPIGPVNGQARVLRGGCFHNSAKFCRSASRIAYPPDQADYDFGFRVTAEAKPPATQPG